MIRYYLFCIRFMWHHRNWENSRQKWKAMDKEWKAECEKRGVTSYGK